MDILVLKEEGRSVSTVVLFFIMITIKMNPFILMTLLMDMLMMEES